jgi:hypothetical protein
LARYSVQCDICCAIRFAINAFVSELNETRNQRSQLLLHGMGFNSCMMFVLTRD